MTVTSFHFAFHQALLLAYAWLNEGRVNKVLVGVSEECSTPMEYISEEKLSLASGGKMDPLNCSVKPGVVLGEASVFFLLSLDPAKKKYGAFSEITIGKNFNGWEDAGLSILSAHGMAGSEEIYRKTAKKNVPSAAYPNIYGALMAAGALESAAAALMLKKQVRYASPVLSDSGPFQIDKIPVPASLHAVQGITHDCQGNLAFVKLVS